MSNDKIERQIQEIEEKLKDLKLALRNRSSEQKPKKPQKGKQGPVTAKTSDDKPSPFSPTT